MRKVARRTREPTIPNCLSTVPTSEFVTAVFVLEETSSGGLPDLPTVLTSDQCASSPRDRVSSSEVVRRPEEERMPEFVVTGGPDGTAGVEIADVRYEPGDKVEATTKAVKWLVDDGYLAPATKTTSKATGEE